MFSRYKAIIIIFVCLSVAAFSFIIIDRQYKIRLGDDLFCIALNDPNVSVLDQSTGSIFQFLGAEGSNQESLQVVLNPHLIKKEINSYETDDEGLLANLVINLKVASEIDLARWQSGKLHQDILNQQAEFSESNISYNEQSGDYRVSWSKEPPPYVIWHVLNRKPNSELKVPDSLSEYYIGYCSRAGGINGKSSNCQFSEVYKTHFLTVTTSESNLPLKAELISLSKNILDKWASSCVEKN